MNNIFFVLAAEKLFLLSCLVLKEKRLAFRASLLFCITPASIFMSANYTESLFAYLSFCGMLELEKLHARVNGPRKEIFDYMFHDGLLEIGFTMRLRAAIYFCLSGLVRANGAGLGMIYLGYSSLLKFAHFHFYGPKHGNYNNVSISFLIKESLQLVGLGMVSVVAPIVCVQYYGYSRFCVQLETQYSIQALVQPAWCQQTVPFIYQCVQKKYWGNGFLNYYELKQIPNFLLAFPMTLLCVQCALVYCKSKKRNYFSRSLKVFPYVLHFFGLVMFCMLIMHVQVLTRFVSACPPVYWYPALLQSQNQHEKTEGRRHNWIVKYFMIYTVLGSAMFSCYYPWT
mmetsp:Transcript_18064/g.22236  ORF Transcript_18064/g.22236 Transcript_18064/m.22236 type:complete len:341 (-) Transcript_18064:3136-4158(-)